MESRWLVPLIIAAIISFSFTAIIASPTYQVCIADGPYAGGHDEAQSEDSLPIGVLATEPLRRIACGIEAIDANGDFVIALASVFIAIFTATLWGATRRLWRATLEQGALTRTTIELTERQLSLAGRQADLAEKQHSVARHQYFATHRPQLAVRRISLHADATGSPPRVSWFIANIGGSRAKILSMDSKIGYTKQPLPAVPNFIIESPMLKEVLIEPGSAHKEKKYLEKALATELIRRLNEKDPMTNPLFFYGYVIYEDILGGKRRMGFCRRYDRVTERFVAVDDSNYEYEE